MASNSQSMDSSGATSAMAGDHDDDDPGAVAAHSVGPDSGADTSSKSSDSSSDSDSGSSELS